jgi:transketolase
MADCIRSLSMDAVQPANSGHPGATSGMADIATVPRTGVKDMTLDELKRFGQVDSKTAGHPEYTYGDGIETTTGPLGKASRTRSVSRWPNATETFGDDQHWTYVFMGDDCLMARTGKNSNSK